MAVDEALLEQAAGGDTTVWLRFYEWSKPTLSLGYFQQMASWRRHVARDCAVVRRQTGGGAILHDRELTYSLVLPPAHPLARRGAGLYGIAHEALIEALRGFGIAAELWAVRGAGQEALKQAYLCFQRRAVGDVVIRGSANISLAVRETPFPPPTSRLPADLVKICGSAQRRRTGALLQHGSLLLAGSPITPQLHGIKELTGLSWSPAEAGKAWAAALLPKLDVHFPQTHTADDLAGPIQLAVRHLDRAKYSNIAWTARR
jgi:lipoate-protein ligase A